MSVLTSRPAESAAAAGGTIGATVTALFAHDWLPAVLLIVTGIIPAAVTALKVNGGLLGLYRAVVYGGGARG